MCTSKYLTIPDLSRVQPALIGPVTDLLTFYSDAFLANKLGLMRAGEHQHVRRGTPNSGADGRHIVLGQDSIDFDVSVFAVDRARHTATLLVRHVPPVHLQLTLPASWMRVPISDSENNWVQVEKSDDGYVAQVGKETFEVRITVDTEGAKILNAELHNSVVFEARKCSDADLSQCAAPKNQTTIREVTLLLSQ